MRFATDDFFHIGAEHVASGKPCQDYALSGICDDAAFAIVSDGCSSGGATDVGARLVSLAAAAAIRAHWVFSKTARREDADRIAVEERAIFEGIQSLLRIPTDDMLATALYAFVAPDIGFVHVRGDGAIALVYRDGRIRLHGFEWNDNRPFYPAYRGDRLKAFIANHGGDDGALEFSEAVWDHRMPDGWTFSYPSLHTTAEGIRGITIPIVPLDLAYMVVFSDGVMRVDGMDWKDVARELLIFKSTAGAFAKRRMIRFIHDAQKKGRGPLDDIAYAVIRVDPEEARADAENA